MFCQVECLVQTIIINELPLGSNALGYNRYRTYELAKLLRIECIIIITPPAYVRRLVCEICYVVNFRVARLVSGWCACACAMLCYAMFGWFPRVCISHC